jgi:protein-disulfide isomerase
MGRTLERVASDVAELKKSHEELASTVKSLKSRAGDGGAYRPTNPDLEAIYLVPVGDGAVRGPAGAKITIVEYADFQCPFCARVAGTLRNLEHQYPNEIRLVYKHQPLPFHQNAKAAAKAAEAAGQQGRFWQMWDVLFEHSGELGPDKLENFASELQLDVNKFRAAMQDPAVAAKIEAQSAEANRLGAMGTPSFFINGRYLAGAQPLESFEAAVDRELKRADQLLASGVKREDLYEKLVAGGRTNR